jgi:hypothetical protein
MFSWTGAKDYVVAHIIYISSHPKSMTNSTHELLKSNRHESGSKVNKI